MSRPRLSICIATYNRAEYIGVTLDNIIPQMTDEVEIVILDGASTDNTSSVVDCYVEMCKQIHYTRLPVKGGVDHDFCKAVELATGEYCWLMSDDDILKQGAIHAVLDAIRGNNYSLIIVNAEVRNCDLSRVVDKKLLQRNTNRVYTPMENEELFIETANYLSFIGCMIINKSLWAEREKERYFGSAFVHVGVIFQQTLPLNTLIVAEPYIIIRYGNAEWSGRTFGIWMFQWPNVIWSFTQFSDQAKSRIVRKEPYRRYLSLLVFRARGAYSTNEYLQFVAPLIESGVRRSLSKLISQLPGCLINLLADLYYSFSHRTSHLPIMEIRNSRFYWMKCIRRLVGPAVAQPKNDV
jgi:abequosyltransferase